jgi:hypothetical protein
MNWKKIKRKNRDLKLELNKVQIIRTRFLS